MFLHKECNFLGLGFLWLWVLFGGFSAHAQDIPSSGQENFANFQNAPVDLILDTYEILTEKHLIRDKAISAAPPISLNSTGLSKAETIKLIESTLMLNGLIIVPVDDQTCKIVLVASSKDPRSEGTKLYTNPEALPPGEEVVSYYMPLTYIAPKEAVDIFTQHIPPHSYGSYVEAPTAQAVIITEDTNTVRQLISLQKLVDRPPVPMQTQFISLQYSDAVKMAATLNSLLGLKSDGNETPANEALTPAPEAGFLIGPAQIEADPRSNRLMILTSEINMPLISELVARLDEPGDSQAPQRRQLRYVQAVDILPALQATLAQGKDQIEAAKADLEEFNRSASGSSSAEGRQSTSGTTPNPNSSTGNLNASTTITPSLKAPSDNSVPHVVTVGRTRLLADDLSNSIIVFGSPDAVSKVFSMIDELDQQPLQVYLSTIIGQLTLSKGSEFGVDILQKYANAGKTGVAFSSLNGSNTTSSTAIPDPTTLLSNTGFPINAGLNLYGVIGNQINSYIRALENTNRFQIISRPSVFTTNNKLAVIASGSQVPVPGSTTSGLSGSNSNLVTTSNVQYQNVLLQLDIIPLINPNHEVSLKIRQTNNSLGTPQTISGNSIPSIVTQEINTEVTVPDSSTVVIGGLISDTKIKTTNAVPILSSIPFLGNLFKDTVNSDQRSELIVMIQPMVISSKADEVSASESERRRDLMMQEIIDEENNVINPKLVPKPKSSSTPPKP